MKQATYKGSFAVWGLLAGMLVSPAVFAAEFTRASDCVVGQRVLNRDNQAGVIVSADGSSCRVKLDATGKIDYNIFWMLRPEGKAAAAGRKAAPAPAAAGGAASTGALASGVYKCYTLAGTQLNYAFIDIRIDGTERYRDKNGKAGSYQVRDGGKIVFTGPLASANAKLLSGGRIGLNMDGGNFFNTSCSKPAQASL